MGRTKFIIIMVLQLIVGVLACCSVDKVFRYQPGQVVKVRGASFKILSGVRQRNGVPAYNVLNLRTGTFVPALSQTHMKPTHTTQ